MKLTSERHEYSVQIYVNGKFSGTGFCVLPDGYLLTCWHVIDLKQEQSIQEVQSHTIEILTKTGEAPRKASFVEEWSSREQDIAVLKINAHGIPVVPLGEDYRVGDTVYAFGFQRFRAEDGSYRGDSAAGVIEGLSFKEAVKGIERELIKVKDFDVLLGMSGAPIWNDRTGCVVGIVVISYNNYKMGRAIPVSVVFDKWKGLKEQNGKKTRLQRLSYAIVQLQNDKMDTKLRMQTAIAGLDEILRSDEYSYVPNLDKGSSQEYMIILREIWFDMKTKILNLEKSLKYS